MAKAKKVEEQYVSQATTTSIKITSRVSIKVTDKHRNDQFYTLEYCEERALPETANVIEERKLLWDICNSEVDKQVEDILNVVDK